MSHRGNAWDAPLITTTEKYLHSLPDADDTALDALDNIRRAPGEPAHQPTEPTAAADPVAPAATPPPELPTVIQNMDPDMARNLLMGLLLQANEPKASCPTAPPDPHPYPPLPPTMRKPPQSVSLAYHPTPPPGFPSSHLAGRVPGCVTTTSVNC